jgi:hypothetical protein
VDLTGEYDVTAEVSVGAVNRILAAVHENEDPRYPVMAHSLRFLMSDVSRGAQDPVLPSERTGLQAEVEVQLSPPTVSLPQAGSLGDGIVVLGRMLPGRWGEVPRASDVSLRVGIRAWVRGSPQPTVPEFLHGDVVVNTDIVRTRFETGLGEVFLPRLVGPSLLTDTFIGLDRGSGLQVLYQPAPGTTVTEDERLLVQQVIRNFVRSDAEPVTFKLTVPEEVHHFDFKLHPANASASLMFVLTDRTPSAGAPDGVAGGLVPSGADFAIAIGRGFLLPLLKSNLVEGLLNEYTFSKVGVSATVRPDWAGSGFELEPGRIVLTVAGNGNISWWGIDDSFTFTVRQVFTLHVVGGSLEPAADGDPVVDFSDIAVGEGYIEGKARDRIREERDKALDQARDQIREQLEVGKRLEDVLAGFHPSPADVQLTGVEIRHEGVVVPGRIGLTPSRPVVVRQVKHDGMIDALESWIPGGTIDRFVWTTREPELMAMARGSGAFGQSVGAVEEHRFVTEDIPPGPVAVLGALCLEVQGTRITPGGGLAPISGSTCGFWFPIPPFLGEWRKSGRRMPVLPLQGVRPDGRVGVVGHYDPWAAGLAPARGPTSMLVHFAAGPWEGEEAALRDILGRVKRGMGVVVVGVLPPGGLAQVSRSSLPGAGAVLFTEDYDGRWSEALGVAKAPATVLVGPGGQVVWGGEGRPTPTKAAKALEEYAEPTGEVSWQALRLGVSTGDRAPEFAFPLEVGGDFSLRRLRGRRVALAFLDLRSEPSVEHLRHLRRAYERAGRAAPVLLAIGDGEGPDQVSEVARAERLPFPLLPDPERSISKRYGVGCWPVTVWIRPDMRVEAVDFGLTAWDGGRQEEDTAPAYR